MSHKNPIPARPAPQSPAGPPRRGTFWSWSGRWWGPSCVGAGTALGEQGAGGASTSPWLLQQLSPTAWHHGTEIRERQKRNFWPQVISTFLTPTMWWGWLTSPGPLHFPINPFSFAKLAFSYNISYTSLFRSHFNVFGRILLLMRVPAIPIAQTLPKMQPKSLTCFLIHQTLPS